MNADKLSDAERYALSRVAARGGVFDLMWAPPTLKKVLLRLVERGWLDERDGRVIAKPRAG